ncbi:hypothetical protein JAAARDRAFT_675099 [Jaapia argillacea MUCL 33604]|uniref:Uncharacterized protein n=1 Tax=Jaapia argillacea MUCL 33604 TaxID=933084 RepID=A0A067Q569_9AGAM|nr:hypothetical protein JAAARDRAFT_675099 [Jaapia argillacea MUCL 33604]
MGGRSRSVLGVIRLRLLDWLRLRRLAVRRRLSRILRRRLSRIRHRLPNPLSVVLRQSTQHLPNHLLPLNRTLDRLVLLTLLTLLLDRDPVHRPNQDLALQPNRFLPPPPRDRVHQRRDLGYHLLHLFIPGRGLVSIGNT